MKIDFYSEEAEGARENFTPPGSFDERDFREVYSHLYTLKKRVRKFIHTGEINERELLNDVIFITNNFADDFFVDFIMRRFGKDEAGVVKSLTDFLGVIEPDKMPGSNNQIVTDVLSDIRTRYSLPKAYHRP